MSNFQHLAARLKSCPDMNQSVAKASFSGRRGGLSRALTRASKCDHLCKYQHSYHQRKLLRIDTAVLRLGHSAVRNVIFGVRWSDSVFPPDASSPDNLSKQGWNRWSRSGHTARLRQLLAIALAVLVVIKGSGAFPWRWKSHSPSSRRCKPAWRRWTVCVKSRSSEPGMKPTWRSDATCTSTRRTGW